MMHLLRVADVRALVRPQFYFRIVCGREAIGWVIGVHPDYESEGQEFESLRARQII